MAKNKDYFYTINELILKDEGEELSEDNIKDLKLLTQFDTMEDVARYLDANIKYLYSIKTINNKVKCINNKIMIYKDNTEEII